MMWNAIKELFFEHFLCLFFFFWTFTTIFFWLSCALIPITRSLDSTPHLTMSAQRENDIIQSQLQNTSHLST